MTDEADEFIRAVMADMMDSQLTVLPEELTRPLPTATRPADRDERFVLAVDLGTGGPKVGLVSLTGRDRVERPLPGRDPPAARAAARCRTPSEWWAWSPTPAARAMRQRRGRARRRSSR